MSKEVKDPFYCLQSNINTFLPESCSGTKVLYAPVVNKAILHTTAFSLSWYGEDWLGSGRRVRRPMSCMQVLDALQIFLYLQLLRRQTRASRWSESECKNNFKNPNTEVQHTFSREEWLQPQSAEYSLHQLLAKVNNNLGAGQIKNDNGFL